MSAERFIALFARGEPVVTFQVLPIQAGKRVGRANADANP